MKNFALLFLLSVSAFAQTQYYSASGSVNDPPYGLIAQLWNGSSAPIYVTGVDITAQLESVQPVTGGLLIFGYGYSSLEENQCTPTSMIALNNTLGPSLYISSLIRVTQQPCTPNGMAYGIPLGPGMWNYTNTNQGFPNLMTCWFNSCKAEWPQGIMIPPNHGMTIYSGLYKSPNSFGWNGYAGFQFQWHN